MKLTKSEVDMIITLSRVEKPHKKIQSYIEELSNKRQLKTKKARNTMSNKRASKRVKLLNYMYRPVFTTYFRKFAKGYSNDCVSEAYVTALEHLQHGLSFEESVTKGLAAGSRLFNVSRVEIPDEDIL